MTDAKCFKCGGPIKAVQDVDGGYVGTCMRCAAIQPYEAVNDVQPEERGALGRPPTDWVTAAKHRMNVLLKEIRAMDDKRTEVEGIHRALSAYGEKNIPAVPWKVGKTTSAEPRAPRVLTPTSEPCIHCGRSFTSHMQYRKTPDGVICRDEVACHQRRAA